MSTIKQSICFNCFTGGDHTPEEIISAAARSGYKSVEMLAQEHWDTVHQHGMRIAIVIGHASLPDGRAPAWALRSKPLEKPRPAPVTTTARIASSSSACVTACMSASSIAASIAFNRSGRLSVITATEPSASYSIESVIVGSQ